MKAPCMNCERKGCGSYHDICEAYQEFRKVKDGEADIRARMAEIKGKYIPEKKFKSRGAKSAFRCHKR